MLRKLRADQSGATAIEYGLIVALLAIACITGLSALGVGSDGMFGRVDTKVTAVTNKVG
jgi:pilus assembly protein Flp/PilA